MELNINAEDVNRLVAEAVLKSKIGDAVKAAVAKELVNLSRSYDNPIESVVRNHVAELCREVLRTEHGDVIRAKVSAALATKLSDTFIDRVCEQAVQRYN